MQKIKLIALLGVTGIAGGIIGRHYLADRRLFASDISSERRLEVVARKKLLATGYLVDLRYYYKNDCVMSTNLGVYDSTDDFDLNVVKATNDGFVLNNNNYYKIKIGYSVGQ